MSKDYPCVHYDGGKCKKFSDDRVTSYCVKGPCDDETPSNADRIRAMSDEELADLQTIMDGAFTCQECQTKCVEKCNAHCIENCLKWLQQPAGEVHNHGNEENL